MLLPKIIGILMFDVIVASAHEMDRTFASFIADVTTSLYTSSSFTLFHCAETENVIELSRFMSKRHKLHDIIRISTNKYTFDESPLAHQNFYVLDLDCEGARPLLIEANERASFRAPTKWLILQELRIDKTENLELKILRMQGIFQDFDVFPDSEVIVGQRIGDSEFTLRSIYRPSPYRGPIVEDRGTWNHDNGIQITGSMITSRRRTNIQGSPLKASAVVTHPDTKNHLEDFTDRTVDVVTKVGYAYSKLLAARMNTTLNITFTTTWGYKDENGTWSGMIGQIHRNKVDFGATNSFIIPSRLDVVAFVQLYAPNRMRFIFRQPPLSYVRNVFSLPFTRNVWMTSMIFVCIGYMVLYFSMLWEWRIVEDVPREEKISGDLEVKPDVGDNFLIVVGAITQQGSAYEPRSAPARIVIFMLLLLCLSLYAAYTANIVALLQSTSDSIKNVQELMDSPMKIGIQDIVYNRYYFGSFADPLRKEFYDRRVKNQKNVWMSHTDGIKKVRNELFAFHVDASAGYDVVQSTYGEDEKCGFEEIDYLYVSDPALAIKRRSPYQEIFRVGAIWVEETGLKERFVRIMYNKKPPCNNQKKFVRVGTIDCYAAYLTIGYGIMLTLTILIGEIIYSRSSKTMPMNSEEAAETRTECSDGSDFMVDT